MLSMTYHIHSAGLHIVYAYCMLYVLLVVVPCTIDYRLSTIDYRLSTIDTAQSTVHVIHKIQNKAEYRPSPKIPHSSHTLRHHGTQSENIRVLISFPIPHSPHRGIVYCLLYCSTYDNYASTCTTGSIGFANIRALISFPNPLSRIPQLHTSGFSFHFPVHI
jgi:hypothetical protein